MGDTRERGKDASDVLMRENSDMWVARRFRIFKHVKPNVFMMRLLNHLRANGG